MLNIKNRATSTLLYAIDDDDTSLTVAAGEGTRFPTSNFTATLEDPEDSTIFERILVGSRTDDTFSSITRGYDVSEAKSWDIGALVELRIIAKHITELQEGQTDLQGQITDLETNKANDDEVVKLTGNQTVAGIKTFSSIPVLPASDPTTDNQAVRKKYTDDKTEEVIENEIIVSENLRWSNDAEKYTTSTTPVKKKQIKLNEDLKTVRIKFDLKAGVVGGGNVRAQIYKNGAAIGILRETSSESYITYSEDISDFLGNDLIQIYGYKVSSADCYVKNFRFYFDRNTFKVKGKTLATKLPLNPFEVNPTNQDP